MLCSRTIWFFSMALWYERRELESLESRSFKFHCLPYTHSTPLKVNSENQPVTRRRGCYNKQVQHPLICFLTCKVNERTVMKHINAGVNNDKIPFLKMTFFGLKMAQHAIHCLKSSWTWQSQCWHRDNHSGLWQHGKDPYRDRPVSNI